MAEATARPAATFVVRLAHRPAELTPEWVQPQLEAIARDARRAWPSIEVPDDALFAHLAARLSVDDLGSLDQLERALSDVRAGEIYLALACARGDAGAIRALDDTFVAELDSVLMRMRLDAADIDDVKQRLRRKLLVGEGEKAPRIAQYGGRGALHSWLRVAATREALGMIRKHSRVSSTDDSAIAKELASEDDPELYYLKGLYRRQFKEAFQEAFRGLEARQRTILRYQMLDGFNIDQIGAVYGVHRATVARWLKRVREDLLEATREILMAKVEVNRTEFDSIMRLIQSQLDVSVHRLLREEGEDAR